MRRLADTHCHLQDGKFERDWQAVLARALDTLEWIVVVGDALDTSRMAVEMSGPRVFATVGFHPYHAGQVCEEALAELRALAAQPGVVALGEIGLDYFNEFSPRAVQKKAFPKQLALAAELGLAPVIHCRDAEADTLAILREHRAGLPGCVMHCFGGNAEFAHQCLELDCHISFAGNITFPKAQPLREAALLVPMERLLLETDAPYLAPQDKRGQRCEPAFVAHTAAFVARLKNISEETLAHQTTENAMNLFRLCPSGAQRCTC